MDSVIEMFHGAIFFTTLGLKNGYFHVPTCQNSSNSSAVFNLFIMWAMREHIQQNVAVDNIIWVI